MMFSTSLLQGFYFEGSVQEMLHLEEYFQNKTHFVMRVFQNKSPPCNMSYSPLLQGFYFEGSVQEMLHVDPN